MTTRGTSSGTQRGRFSRSPSPGRTGRQETPADQATRRLRKRATIAGSVGVVLVVGLLGLTLLKAARYGEAVGMSELDAVLIAATSVLAAAFLLALVSGALYRVGSRSEARHRRVISNSPSR